MPDNTFDGLVNPDVVGSTTAEDKLRAEQELDYLEQQQATLTEVEPLPQQPTEVVTQEQPTQQIQEQPVQETQPVEQPPDKPLSEMNEDERKAYFKKLERMGGEYDFAVVEGLKDFATDFANIFLPEGRKFAKATNYELGVAQVVRDISSVAIPMMVTQGLGMAGGQALNAKVGHALGKSRFIQWLGSRGVEAGSASLVGGISSHYEEDDNILGSIKKALPAQWDFIPDNMATLDTDSPDVKRQKAINEDVGLGFLIPLVGSLRKLNQASSLVREITEPRLLKQSLDPQIVAETPQAKAWLDANVPEDSIQAQARQIYDSNKVHDAPWEDLDVAAREDLTDLYIETKQITTDPELADLAHYAVRQEDALDELGYYNKMVNPDDTNVALRGVHDLFDWNETAMRTVDDFGIVGASVDAARIADNLGTVNGRLGSVISVPAVKFGAATLGATEDIVMGLTRELRSADKFGVVGKDWVISSDQIDAAGQVLVKEMFDPSIDTATLRSILEPIQVQIGDELVSVGTGYSSMFRQANGYDPSFTDMDIAKTQAYLQTSLAGQVADLSEAIRINGESASTQFAQEKLFDRLTYMFKQNGLNEYYASAKGSVVKALKDGKPDVAQNLSSVIDETIPIELRRIQQEAEEFTNTLKWFQENEPEMVEVFQEMYELSDGRIKDINDINKAIRNSFTNWNVWWKKDPNAKNMLAGALRANYQNSLLSSAETGSSALLGNLGGLVAQPLSYFAGAVSRGDLKDLQRGWMAYSSVFDTMQKALPYAGKMFWKASTNPKSMLTQTKLDFVIQNEEMLEQYKKLADIQAEKGNMGLRYLINQYEMWDSLSKDPIFRFVPNLFTGFDGFAKSAISNSEARFRAMNAIEQSGGAITSGEVKRLADIEYNRMFDKQGELIIDEAVKYQTDEIALNIDLGIVQGLDKWLQKMPFMRTLVMFPTTMVNMVKQMDDFGPISVFQKDINQLAYTPTKAFVDDPDLVNDILVQRGYQVNNMTDFEKIRTVVDLKNRVRGKKAIAALVGSAAMYQIIQGNLTGDGLYDEQAQQSRVTNSNWKARTMNVNGIQVEYEDIIGPGMANWVATYANIIDNFDMIGETAVENLGRKMMFILGGAFTEKTVLNTLRPLTEMLMGNTFSMNRWAAGHVNALGGFAGLRGTANKILDAGLKEVESDLLSIIQNKNSALFMDQANRLPYIYNPVTGAVPNDYNLMQRLWNATTPIKIHSGQTPEEKFLQDIEWDGSTTFATRDGVDLTAKERSEGLRLMGEQGYFRDSIAEIMRSTNAQNAVAELQEARRRGIPSTSRDLKYYHGIHIQLRAAQQKAEDLAFQALNGPLHLSINQRIMEQEQNREMSEFGILENILNIPK